MASEVNNPFISVQYLRDNSVIGDNVDAKVLQKVIKMAESKYIKQVLGGSLFNKLVLDANNNSVTGNYVTLLEEYVIPCLLQYSVYESIPYLSYKFRNKGVQKQTSDNSQPIDLSELTYLRDNVLNTAEFYSNELINYLKVSTTFPEYNQNNNGDLAPQSSSFFAGFHIPKGGGRCYGDPGGEINL